MGDQRDGEVTGPREATSAAAERKRAARPAGGGGGRGRRSAGGAPSPHSPLSGKEKITGQYQCLGPILPP